MYLISHVSAYHSSSYTVLNKVINGKGITKIREVYYSAENAVFYEVYYNISKRNSCKAVISNNISDEFLEPVYFELDTGTPEVMSEFILPES